MKPFAAILVLSVLANSILAAPPRSESERIIFHAIGQRDAAAAIIELEKLRAANEKLFISSNYDYLLARVAEADGRFALALTNYQAVARRDPQLAPYALAHISKIARSTGNLILERVFLHELMITSSSSLIAANAQNRLARNSFESGNYSDAIRLLSTFSAYVNGKNSRENYALLGEAYLKLGNADRAREILTRILDEMPNAAVPDDASLAAVQALDILDAETGDSSKRVPELTEAEHLRRAGIYQFNRDFARAKMHYEAVTARFLNGANAPNAILQVGRGYVQQGDHVEALKYCERVVEQFPDSSVAKEALLQAAAAYSRVGKTKEAMKRYQQFIEKYPTDEKLDRAYLNIIDILRDQGEDQDALKWCTKTQQTFPGKVPEALAIFAAVRIRISREEWQDAITQLDLLKGLPDLGSSSPGGTSLSETAFLRAFSLEKLKRYDDAINAFLAVSDGREQYYGWRATEHLRSLAADDAAASFHAQKVNELTAGLKSKDPEIKRENSRSLLRMTDLPVVREKAIAEFKSAVKSNPKYRVPVLRSAERSSSANRSAVNKKHRMVADKFEVLGLYDEAAPEFEAAGADDAAIATAYRKGDRGDRAAAFIEPFWKKMPSDYPIELIPRDHLEMLYPAPYSDEIVASASKYDVDPRLLLAIMRQESRFSADAHSAAAARGLMQFITTTSTRIAGELDRKGFSQDDLYHPSTSILFGSKYVADLFVGFPEQPAAVAASYNAGDDNVKRWYARAKSSLPERYVPELMFSQTKDYVCKVMANYRVYQFLYDRDLNVK